MFFFSINWNYVEKSLVAISGLLSRQWYSDILYFYPSHPSGSGLYQDLLTCVCLKAYLKKQLCTHHKYQSSNLDHDLIRPFQNVRSTFHQSLNQNRYCFHILVLSSSVIDGLHINFKKITTLPLFSSSFINQSTL